MGTISRPPERVHGGMPRDACYYKVKRQFKIWPSARASQALAKCRKSSGHVRKSEKGCLAQAVGLGEMGQCKDGAPVR